jgi:hypothetical protein
MCHEVDPAFLRKFAEIFATLFLSWCLSHLSPVSMTPVINLYRRISPRIFIKIRNCVSGILRGPVLVVLKDLKNLTFKSLNLSSD